MHFLKVQYAYRFAPGQKIKTFGGGNFVQTRLEERLRLRDLRLIYAVAKERSLVGAARLLQHSQPAVTKALQALESSLQTELFTRTPKGVSPTAAGALLVDSATRILREMGALDQALVDLKSERGRVLCIGAETGSADALLMSAVSRLNRAQSDLEIRVVEGDCEHLIDDLAESHRDLVVGRLVDRALMDDVAATPLYDEPLVLMARAHHPIFEASPWPNDLPERFAVITPECKGQVAREIEAFVGEHLPRSHRRVRSSSISLIKEMVRSTDCLAAGPATLMAGDIGRGDVRIMPLNLGAAARPAGLIRRKNSDDGDFSAFFQSALQASASSLSHLSQKQV